jgi:Leucine-rich repeat (LRR) protein
MSAGKSLAQVKMLTESELQKAKEYKSLDEALKEPDKVFKLSLTALQGGKLPADVAKLPNLQAIFLAGNAALDLKQVLDQLSTLPIQELYLRENQLSALPPEVAKLQNLRQLDLSFNKYTTLPAEIGKLPNLQILNLLENKFVDVEKDKVRKLLPNTKIIFEIAK